MLFHVFKQTRDADAIDADVVIHSNVLVGRRVDKTRHVAFAVDRVVTFRDNDYTHETLG